MKITILLQLILLAMTISSCGPEVPSGSQGGLIDKDLESYVEFYKDSKGGPLSRSLDVIFGEMPNKGTIGFCEYFTDGTRAIVISKAYWNRASESEKNFLMFHEMGHCDLNLDHNDSEINGIPQSIMHTYVFNIPENMYNNYVDALFNR